MKWLRERFFLHKPCLKHPLQPNKTGRERENKELKHQASKTKKTRIINQLRMNSKALFKPSLKDPQPIVIEDDDSPEFSSMEEMAVNILKRMTVKKEKSKSNKGETMETPFLTLKRQYPIDFSQHGIHDYGLDLEQESIGTSPHAEDPYHSSQYIKPEIKTDTLGVQGSIKGTQGKEPEVINRYNMRARRITLVDHNKSITEQDEKKM
jgi:hypothetical protein